MAKLVRYTKKVGEELCELLAGGMTLTDACKRPGMPTRQCVYQWLASTDDRMREFQSLYEVAKDLQVDYWVDQSLSIADDGTNDTYVDDDGEKRIDFDHIHRSKLRVQVRQWYAGKLRPKKYGEKLQQEITGKDGAQLIPVIELSYGNKSDSSDST